MHRHDDDSMFKSLTNRTEEHVRRAMEKSGEGVDKTRDTLKRQWDEASSRASEWKDIAGAGVRSFSKAADRCAHRNTWTAIGLAALVGGVIAACCVSKNRRY